MIQRAVILSTGDEITTGKVVDSNSNYLADKLNEIGIDLWRCSRLGTCRNGSNGPGAPRWNWVTWCSRLAASGPPLTILTTETVARLTGKKLWRHEPSVDHMRRLVRVGGPRDAGK